MRKLLVLSAALAVLLSTHSSNSQEVLPGARFPCGTTGQLCFKPPVAGMPLGFQQISAPSSATSLTIPTGATSALIICETQTVRWRDDGTAPTTSVGMLLPTNTAFNYTGNLSAFQLIQTASNSTCDVSYYR